MFTEMAIRYYDKIYASMKKDYKAEVEYLLNIIKSRCGLSELSLLDVACGTGMHLKYLREYFGSEGLDVSPHFAELARKANPGLTIHVGDMRSFKTGRKYDIITCLFSSIGYMQSYQDLTIAIGNMMKHLGDPGLLLVEPWFAPDSWCSGRVSLTVVNEEKLKIARMNTTKVDGNVACFDFHYLIGTPEDTYHFTERHRAGLFTVEQMKQAFTSCGLNVEHDEQGPGKRGLYVGTNWQSF